MEKKNGHYNFLQFSFPDTIAISPFFSFMSHAQPIRHTTYVYMYVLVWYVRLIRDWYAYIHMILAIHTTPYIPYIRTYPRQRYRVLVEFLVKSGTRRLVCSCCS